jgi:nucleoside 2-deoxyribosyltransferase
MVYVATHLFDHVGKLYGARIERACHAALLRVLERRGIDPVGPLTFLPFRDSNESTPKRPGESLTEAIFRIDCERLDSAAALVAPFQGLSQDAGIAFEMGYATARRVPMLSIASSFVRFSYDVEQEPSRVEPLLAFLSHHVVDASAIPAGGQRTRAAYLTRIEDALQNVELRVGQALEALAEGGPGLSSTLDTPSPESNRVHLEFGGGLYEYQRLLAVRVAEALTRQGLTVSISERYLQGGDDAAVAADLRAIGRSQVVVTLGDGPDMEAEIAAVQGYAWALGRRVVLYASTRRRLCSGSEYRTQQNLMVFHSVDRIIDSLEAIPGAVQQVLELVC